MLLLLQTALLENSCKEKCGPASSLPPLPGLAVAVARELCGLNDTNSSELSSSTLASRQGKKCFGLASRLHVTPV